MAIIDISNSKFYIGGTAVVDKNSDFAESDFSSQTWTEIGGTEDLGSAGDKANVTSVKLIGSGRVKKLIGTKDAGQMTVVCALDPSDAGQLAAIAACTSQALSAFRLEFPDAPSGGTPTTRYFAAYVSGAAEGYSSADSEIKLTLTLEITSNIVSVAASA